MPAPDAPNPTPGGRPPRGLRAELDSLLENWLERAEDAAGDHQREASDLAAVFGFLRRTDAQLLVEKEWEALRAQIEDRARAVLRDTDRSTSLGEMVARLVRPLEGELLEFQALHDQLEHTREHGRPSRTSTRGTAAGQARIRAVQLAERVDHLILAAVLSLEAKPSDALLSEIEALAVRASHAGESFHSVARWFAAMERSMDPALRLTRWQFRGDYPLHADRALHASSAWITRTHARIRLYQAQLADQTAELRQSAVLARIDSGASSNTERWQRLAELAPVERAKLVRSAHSSHEVGLLFRLAQPTAPILAAADATAVPSEFVEFEWAAPDLEAVARCTFAVGERSDALVIRFFDENGALARSMDGKLVQWLGQSTTIANAQARFTVTALRQHAVPSAVVERVRALFVGEALWHAEWDPPDSAEVEP